MDTQARQRRRQRIRARVHGTATRPRAAVWRSLQQLGLQIIDDEAGKTLVAVTTKHLPEKERKGKSKLEQAGAVGALAAQKATEAGVTRIVFDRGGYRYHGRVAAVAEGLRTGGLEF